MYTVCMYVCMYAVCMYVCMNVCDVLMLILYKTTLAIGIVMHVLNISSICLFEFLNESMHNDRYVPFHVGVF